MSCDVKLSADVEIGTLTCMWWNLAALYLA